MRNFLAERFQLKTHEEMQAYALVQGNGGSKMKPADSASPGPRMRMGRGQLSSSGISMEMLTRQLGQNVGRNVIDKTALKGNYDIELNFVPEVGQGGPVPPSAEPARPMFTYVTLYRGAEKVFESTPFGTIDVQQNRLKTMPMQLQLPLSSLEPGEYLRQVTVLDPKSQKAAYWQAPVFLVP